ncbi:hypothetical protein BN990_01664 [Virgibacillus salexigens]|uniref:Uncharacterized protein n=1 Tax=Virgibacillus massiliensis TaxID=1462526 RepID=A0A024QAR5_9BACI|nr:hypothetical protein BN990_01664 [Virgibacillus massiliensis]
MLVQKKVFKVITMEDQKYVRMNNPNIFLKMRNCIRKKDSDYLSFVF